MPWMYTYMYSLVSEKQKNNNLDNLHVGRHFLINYTLGR